jgi:hypothetical protein
MISPCSHPANVTEQVPTSVVDGCGRDVIGAATAMAKGSAARSQRFMMDPTFPIRTFN